MYKRDTAAVYDSQTRKLLLDRYPVVSVNSITPKGSGSALLDSSSYHIHDWAGMVIFLGTPFFDELDIDYTGGYQTLPADLELALWIIFDAMWPLYSANSGGGGGAGAGGVPGAISSISVPDVGTLRFDTGSSGSGTGGGAGAVGLIASSAINLLEPYRRIAC